MSECVCVCVCVCVFLTEKCLILMYYVVALYDIHYWPCLEVTLFG